MNSTLSGLARRLVADRLLDRNQALLALNGAAEDRISLVTKLISSKLLTGDQIAAAASAEFDLPLLNLDAFDLNQSPLDIVDSKLIRRHGVLPLLQRANRLYLAISDPGDTQALDEVTFQTGLRPEIILVAEEKLQAAIRARVAQAEDTRNFSANDDTQQEILELLQEDKTQLEEEPRTVDETPIVKFVNEMLLDAIRIGASDIHIEPYEKNYRIRFRIDGVLHIANQPPLSFMTRIASRIKVMSKLDISERRMPQDGRVKIRLSRNRTIHFRVSTLPTSWGEKIVLRLLDPAALRIGIDALGYENWQTELYLDALSQHQGMILITGPTGSGKTVSLYSGLSHLNTPDRNIASAEDPVEINLEGINQVSINPKIGLDFATALRAFLRQDPDVVMIGEIRDLETAEMAVKAAHTGHLVLSTLHTNSAAETLSRLQSMGLPAYNLATAVKLIIAQRLARRLCNHCKESIEIPEKVLTDEGFNPKEINGLQLFRATGCSKCKDGYKGRVGIYEVVPITETMSRIIINHGNAMEFAEAARKAGFHNLRHAALLKVGQGLTSLEEANRLT